MNKGADEQWLIEFYGEDWVSCEIVFPNGVTVRLSGEIAASTLVAEFNALAAILSIAKWKRMMEFYGDTSSAGDLNVVYSVADNAIIHSNHIGNEQ